MGSNPVAEHSDIPAWVHNPHGIDQYAHNLKDHRAIWFNSLPLRSRAPIMRPSLMSGDGDLDEPNVSRT